MVYISRVSLPHFSWKRGLQTVYVPIVFMEYTTSFYILSILFMLIVFVVYVNKLTRVI